MVQTTARRAARASLTAGRQPEKIAQNTRPAPALPVVYDPEAESSNRAEGLKGDVVVWRFVSPALMVLAVCIPSTPAFAAENYQTNIGPTPLDGSNRANVLGRGSVLATLDGTKFTLHGTFAGLATPATAAHLSMGTVMGGTGPVIYDVTVTQAQSGQVSGTVTLTPEQVSALK